MAEKSKPSKAAAKPAETAKAPAKTVKIAKPASDNRAVVVRKPRAELSNPQLPRSERARLVAEAAYFLAEARGFAHGHAESDWHAAEQAIDRSFSFT